MDRSPILIDELSHRLCVNKHSSIPFARKHRKGDEMLVPVGEIATHQDDLTAQHLSKRQWRSKAISEHVTAGQREECLQTVPRGPKPRQVKTRRRSIIAAFNCDLLGKTLSI